MNTFSFKLKLYMYAERSMGDHLESYGRKKLLKLMLRNRQQIGPQIASLIGQTEFHAKVFSVKVNRCLGDVQDIGDFLNAHSLLYHMGGNRVSENM